MCGRKGIKEEFVVLLHRGGRLSNKTLQLTAHWDFFFLSFSAMGRRPEINHSQLQGQQCQSHDMPQETVSFVCYTLCS